MLKHHSLTAVLLLMGACSRTPDVALVATVDSEGITKATFDSAVASMVAHLRVTGRYGPGSEPRIRRMVLNRMVEALVFEHEAKRLGLGVSEAEIEVKLKELTAGLTTPAALDTFLVKTGRTTASMKSDIRRDLLRERVLDKLAGRVVLVDAEVAAFYKEHVTAFADPEAVRVRHIFVAVPPTAAAAERQTARKKADEIRARAAAPHADFAAIAAAVSDAPDKSTGGDMGSVSRGTMPEDFDRAVFGMAVGEVTQALSTRSGYEILEVVERKPMRPHPFDEVKDTVRDVAVQERQDAANARALESLVAKAKVVELLPVEAEAPTAPASSPAGHR